MNKHDKGMEAQVLLAVIGFFLFGGLSLGAGNSMLTSLIRGALGLLALFGLGFLFRLALELFVGKQEKKVEPRGQIVDLVLPGEMIKEQKANERPDGETSARKEAEQAEMAADFVPLGKAAPFQDVDEEEAKKMAQALRHLED